MKSLELLSYCRTPNKILKTPNKLLQTPNKLLHLEVGHLANYTDRTLYLYAHKNIYLRILGGLPSMFFHLWTRMRSVLQPYCYIDFMRVFQNSKLTIYFFIVPLMIKLLS